MAKLLYDQTPPKNFKREKERKKKYGRRRSEKKEGVECALLKEHER